MIRRKRETSQTDLFAGALLEKRSSFESPLERSEVPSDEAPVSFVKNFENPILMSRPKDNEEIAVVEKAADPVSSVPEDIPLPTEVPEEPPEPDTNELLRKDSERLIINRDFADGFYLSEESRHRHRPETPEDRERARLLHERRKRRFKIASVVILSLMALLLFNWQEWVVDSPLFTVQNVYVRDNSILTKDEILRLADIENGLRLSQVDVVRTADRIKTNPLVRHVAVSRSYPSSIVITVYERQPFAFVTGEDVYAVDESGFTLPKLRSNMIYNLPVVTGLVVNPQVGRPLNSPKLMAILKFMGRVRDVQESLFYEISEINVQKDDFIVYLNNVRTAFRVDDEHSVRTMIYLNAAANYFRQNPELRHVREIDLRFDGQIVVRRTGKF